MHLHPIQRNYPVGSWHVVIKSQEPIRLQDFEQQQNSKQNMPCVKEINIIIKWIL